MATRIQFIRCSGIEKKKNDIIDKKLSEVRTELNLSQNENFACLEQNRLINYTREDEYNTKLKVIVKDNKVYIGKEIIIKQGNAESSRFKLFNESLNGELSPDSYLEELREKLPLSLKNEKFLKKKDGDRVENDEEKDTTISDICTNDIIWMTGQKVLLETGSINLDHAKRVYDNMDLISKSEKNVIFFGAVGAGKTTLTNIICGTDFATSESDFSLTRNVQFAKSLKAGDCIAIDFPGLGSVKDQLNHFSIQQTTLSVIPVRMICFVIKWENRHDPMLENIQIMKQIFEDYKDNTVIIITHSEPIISNYAEQAKIEHVIENMLSYKRSRIFYSYKNINYDILFTQKLKPAMQNMVNIKKLIIKSKNFINHMKIIGDDLFKSIRSEFQENFNKTLSKFECKFEEYKDNNDAKRALFFALKLFKNKHIRKYTKEIRKLNTDDSLEFSEKIICEIILYSNRIHNQFINLVQPELPKEEEKNKENENEANKIEENKAIKKVNIGLQISNQDTEEEYNKFKQCPYCGTIWFRYTGCNGVYCGKRGTQKTDQISGCFKNYYVEYTNGLITVNESQKLTYDRINDSELGQILYSHSNLQPDKEHLNGLDLPINFNLLTEDEKKENEKKKTENKMLLRPVGCGHFFDWRTATDVTKEIIEKLGSDLGKNFTDFYSDVLEIKRELKVKSFVAEIKDKLNILRSKSNLSEKEKDEKRKIEIIISKSEEYETLKNSERENLDEVKENSSTQKDEQSERRNNRIKLFEEIIKLLWEIDYQVIS